jgi:hypothetical protein
MGGERSRGNRPWEKCRRRQRPARSFPSETREAGHAQATWDAGMLRLLGCWHTGMLGMLGYKGAGIQDAGMLGC